MMRMIATTALLILAAPVLACTGTGPGPGIGPVVEAAAQEGLEGEYGLWVSHVAGRAAGSDGSATAPPDSLRLAWLTDGAVPGVVEVWVDGDRVERQQTDPAGAHRVTLDAPPSGRIELRYGSLAQAEARSLHRTAIDVDRDAETPPPGILSGVDSLYVVGDVHGEYETLSTILRESGLIDAEGAWTGGSSHVVFLGDIFDRGPDVTRTLWFMYRLEEEARAAGGGAHVVLGNHEVMIFTHDIRYVSPKESLLARRHGVPYPALFDVRLSVLGRWLARRPTYLKVDDVILAHGGITPTYANLPVEAFNDSIRGYVAEDVFYEWGDTTVAFVTDSADVQILEEAGQTALLVDSLTFERRSALFFGNDSPFWFRGYVQSDTLDAALDEVLEAYDSRIHVIGHTPVPTIEPLYGGRVVPVDLADPATEMLLLVRDGPGDSYRAERITIDGVREALEIAPEN